MAKRSVKCGVMVLALFGAAVVPSLGQKVSVLSKAADAAFATKDYRTAIENYEKVLAQKPKDHRAQYRLGYSYLANKQPGKAVPMLAAVQRATRRYNPELFFMLGQAYHQNHSFDSAMYFYREFRGSLKRADIEGVERTEKYIDECRVGKALLANPVNVRLQSLGANINSPHADFVPVVTQDENLLVFTSRRKGNDNKLAPDGEPFEDIYYSVREKGQWTAAKNIGSPLNSDRHDACVAISPDGKTLYVYKDTNGGDIYKSDKQGTGWSTPVSMGPVINSEHYEPSLSVSDDGEYVFFSSNRPGGYGGLDIYVSIKQPDGKWGEPLNLGPIINTPYDEDAPYIHSASNTLYFSSRGHKTMGGHDVFKTDINAFTWSPPVNLGYPINTAADDIHYIVPSSGRHAYFATTSEKGMGRQDIYMVVYPDDEATDSMAVAIDEPVIVDEPVAQTPTVQPVPPTEPKTQPANQPALPPNQLMVAGKVTDSRNGKPLSASVTFTSGTVNKHVTNATSDSLSGSYAMAAILGRTYTVTVNKPGYLLYSGTLVAPQERAAKPVAFNISLKPIAEGANVVLQNIYFEVNQAEIKPAAYNELEYLFKWLQANPGVRVEISGHTDNTGNAQQNLDLSGRRARAVFDYLVGKGIGAERLEAKGYGAERPMASNSTETGRMRNRRTEFRILAR